VNPRQKKACGKKGHMSVQEKKWWQLHYLLVTVSKVSLLRDHYDAGGDHIVKCKLHLNKEGRKMNQ